MQDNVDIYTKALIRVIKDSEEYREFYAAKHKLARMPELKRQINEYRTETFRLQNYGDAQTLYERVKQFNEQHATFRKDPLVNEYLSTELAVCRMLQKIFATLVDNIDLELDDVAKGIRIK